jgi:sodium-dependent dicarboxylate transporter 2/3/5
MSSADDTAPDAAPAEASWLLSRQRIGLTLAPLCFIGVLLLRLPGLTPAAHRLAAVVAAVMVLWVTEALPMPVTALMAAAACVLLQVAPAKEVFLPFADPLIFLFIGAFILARAVFFMGWIAAWRTRFLRCRGSATARSAFSSLSAP